MNWSGEDIPTQKYVSLYTIQTNNLAFWGWNDALVQTWRPLIQIPQNLYKICVQLCMPASPLLGVRAEMGISRGFLDRQSSQNVSFRFNKELLSSKVT